MKIAMRAVLVMMVAGALVGLAQTQPSARPAQSAAEIDRLLARISTYQPGTDPAPAIEFDELVEQSMASAQFRKVIEIRLLQFLQSKATPAGKEVAYRGLSLVGTSVSSSGIGSLVDARRNSGNGAVCAGRNSRAGSGRSSAEEPRSGAKRTNQDWDHRLARPP